MLSPKQQRLLALSQIQRSLPPTQLEFLLNLRSQGVNPQVIFDIGSCVLNWYNQAQQVWPKAQYYVLEAMDSVEFLYQAQGLSYHLGVLSNSDRRTVTFWQNDEHPAGNSYYRENQMYNPRVDQYYNDSHKRILSARTVDSIILEKGWCWPDFVKMDVQGCEQDVLQGMTLALLHVQHLILELQSVEYNSGAPLAQQVVTWLDTQGFDCVAPLFCNNGADGDYYFRRRS